MNAGRRAERNRWPSALVVAVGLLLMTVLAACGAMPATTPTPEGSNVTPDEESNSGPSDGTDRSRTEEQGGFAVDATAPKLSDYQTYAWVGVIVEGELEGPHLEIKRGCDSWVLMPANEEIEQKLRENIGKELTVWGDVYDGMSIYMMQTIKVSSAYAEGDPMVKMYVPDYPCPGETEPGKPLPPDYGSGGYYGGVDLQDGEIAVIGRLVQAGDRWYLETPNGKIVLTGNVKPAEIGGGEAPPVSRDLPMPEDCVLVEPDMPVSSDGNEGGGVSGYGCATPSSVSPGVPGVDDDWDDVGYAAPTYSCKPATEDTLVVGRWSVQDGALAIDVRYTSYWGEYVCEYLTPMPIDPQPEPDTSVGVIYGHLEVGPLCPVEPCNDDARDVFSGKVLVLEAVDGGEQIKVELTPDGWFKQMVPAGTYRLSMPDCPWMGCDSAFPVDVRIAHDLFEELTVRIDTGIR